MSKKLSKIGYELRDVAVVQAPVSFCNHRGEVNPFINVCGREVYPVFVAPMASVTDQNNWRVWLENGLTPVVPRSVMRSEENPDGLIFEERMEIAKETFVSVSLKEAQVDLVEYLMEHNEEGPFHICIDIAHGTLSELYNICKKLKFEIAPSRIVLMTGNVANPNAYYFYADAGIDYCRISVGSGSRCISSANVSIHYPMATLLDQLNEERKSYARSHNGNAPTKIIADGGIGWFDDIQKSLALGADAVMCGKIFAECEEACDPTYWATSLEEAKNKKSRIYDEGKVKLEEGVWHRYRDYYGMSTKRAQKQTGGTGNVTSEGIDKPVEIKYPVSKWVDNMQSYLRSCMTYTDSRTLDEFREKAEVIILGGSGDAAYRK